MNLDPERYFDAFDHERKRIDREQEPRKDVGAGHTLRWDTSFTDAEDWGQPWLNIWPHGWWEEGAFWGPARIRVATWQDIYRERGWAI